MKKAIIILFISLMFFSACSKESSVPAQVLLTGNKSAVDKLTRMQIRTDQQYQLIWEMNRGYFIHHLPKVDFSKNMVLAYFAGKKASKGYKLDLKQVRRAKNGLHIEIYETDSEVLLPGEEGITPYIMITVPQSDEALHFVIIPRLKAS